MVLNIVYVGLTRFHIREIAAELRGVRICRYCAIRYKTGFGLIGILVVVPELFAGVLALRVNLAAERDLVAILVSLNKRIHRRARVALAVAEALEQACTSEYRVVLCAGKADKAECRRYLIGRAANAKPAEQRCRRLCVICVVSRSRNIIRTQVHVGLHLVDEQRRIGFSGRAIDGQAIEGKVIDRYLPNRSRTRIRRPVNIAAHKCAGRASRIVHNGAHGTAQRDIAYRKVARMGSDEPTMHVLVLRRFAILLVAILLNVDFGIMELDVGIFHRYPGATNGITGVEAISIHVDRRACAIVHANIVS